MILLGLEVLVFDWDGRSDFAACVRHCCISLSVLMCHLQGLLVMVLVSSISRYDRAIESSWRGGEKRVVENQEKQSH